MANDRFMIMPIQTGLETDQKPWQIMDDAFSVLQNAYVFRSTLRKRFGTVLMGTVNQSRFRIQVGTTSGAGNLAGIVPGASGAVGQGFSIGASFYTVFNPGAGANPMRDNGTPATTTKTFNLATGAFNFVGAPINTAVFFYPALPVMGLTQYEIGAINNHPSFGFDPRFAYKYTPNVGWDRAGTASAGNPLPIWHGTDSQFFWTANWDGLTPDIVILFVTNFNAHVGLGLATDDPIWSLNNNTWTPFTYSPDAVLNFENTQPYTVTQTSTAGTIITNYVQQARIIVSFKNRLLLLNTIENNANGYTQYDTTNHASRIASGNTPATYLTSTNIQYKNRVRYSHNGSPFADNAWLEPNFTYQATTASAVVVADGGGFIDATTEEAIVSAEFIKDRLIVYFERSTWELAYTGNEILPFVWQKINTELGSQATFATVPFDKQVLTIGNTGVHSCNGANVDRIDNKIPDNIFQFKVDNDDQLRTCGIRDYRQECVYWSFVSDNETPVTQKFPNQILLYNYRNDSWAYNDDCFTAFGYFEQQTDTTWNSTNLTWGQSNFTWQSGVIQAQQRVILAGTPEGFVLIIDADVSRNAPSMQITTMTIPSTASGVGFVDLTVINHNLDLNDYVAVENTVGIALPITSIYRVTAVIDANNVTIEAPDISGTYTGGGTLARVSNIEILSKQWNPYIGQDRNFYLSKIDFAVQRTGNGQLTVDYYPSATELSMIQEGINNGSIMGNSILETTPYALYPLEAFQDILWHPIYFQTTGEFVQIAIYYSPDQIANPAIAWEDFQLQALTLHTQPTSQRLE